MVWMLIFGIIIGFLVGVGVSVCHYQDKGESDGKTKR